MLTSLLVLMFLCCDFWDVCYSLVDCRHIGLYSVFAFMFACIHLGKFNLDFVVVWHFSLLLLCFFNLVVGAVAVLALGDCVDSFCNLRAGVGVFFLVFGF